jgi:dihydroneopterin aldolase
MRGTIDIIGLSLFAHPGATEAEKLNGQRFVIDLSFEAEIAEAARTDKLAAAIDYAEVIAVAQAAFLDKRFDLIEAASAHVAAALLAHFPRILSARVTVKKPAAPVPAVIDYVAAIVERRRDG